MNRHLLILTAAICHQANRAYCAALGDHSQLPWSEAPDWQRDSALKGVQFIWDNPNSPPSASHENWLAEKQAAGWVYGEIKNPDAKPPTHPCFVPYDMLPTEQKAKDYIFGAIAMTMHPRYSPTASVGVFADQYDRGTVLKAAAEEADPQDYQPNDPDAVQRDPRDVIATKAA